MFKILSVILSAIIIIYTNFIQDRTSQEARIKMLNVGQGDSFLITTNDGKLILIDGGPDDRVLEELASGLPYWKRKIDLMISSHGDSDHIAGLVEVLGHYDVESFAYNGLSKDSNTFEKLMDKVENEQINTILLKKGDRVKIGCCLSLDVLWPRENNFKEAVNANDFSVAFILTYGSFDMYFAGDLPANIEQEMIGKGILDVEVMKVSHHGSINSTSEKVLDALTPEVALISAGLDNPYRHPHPSVINKMQQRGLEIFRSDIEGAVEIKVFKDSYRIKREMFNNK